MVAEEPPVAKVVPWRMSPWGFRKGAKKGIPRYWHRKSTTSRPSDTRPVGRLKKVLPLGGKSPCRGVSFL